MTSACIQLFVDGQTIFDVVDEWHMDNPASGGWFALRNWRPGTAVKFDWLAVYTK